MASSEIDKLERLVRENPKGRQFAILADAYRKDGQLDRALEVLTPGLEHHPDYVSARVVLGRVLMALGDKPKAREAFARVIALDPESVIALKALADLAEEQGEATEALRWSGQLLAVDPGNEEAIKQTERLTAAAPAEAAAEPRLSGIVPMEMDPPVEEPAAAPVKTVEIQAPVKTVEITVQTPMISVQNLAPRFSAASEPLAQEPEPLPLATPLSDEAQTEATAQLVRPMDALEPTSYEGPADATTERLAGMDPVGMSESEIAGIGAASGFEPTSGPLDTREIAAIPLAGLDRPGDGVGAGEPPPAGAGLELEQEIELGAAPSNEFQESSAAETLRRASGANEFQEDSVAETLRRRSGANEFQAPDDGLSFIEPPAAAAPQAPVFTPVPLPVEELEPAVAEPEPVVTEAMAELYASQGHLVAALEVYRELAMRNPDDLRYADRIVELEMFAGGTESVSAVQTFESVDLDVAPMPVDMMDEPSPAAPVAESIAAMELTESAEGKGAGPGWHAHATGGTPVSSWLAEVFAEALPVPSPKRPSLAEPAAEVAPDSDVSPRGAPTRPASGSFSLNSVFGEGGGAPAPKAGSFDDFFGASAPAPAPAPAEPGAPSIRPRPSSSTSPASEDDLTSFQDWLKGLKK
jgi:tetratricopeptide (TPR) repeat protein